MSNEISLRIDARLKIGELRDRFGPLRRTLSQTTGLRWAQTVTLTSDWTTIVAGDLSTKMGRMMAQNASTAVSVVLGPSSDSAFNRIKPKDLGYIGLVANTTIMAKITTDTTVTFAPLDLLIWSS